MSGRYPYTYACDYLRSQVTDFQEVGGTMMRVPAISRAQASQARQAIARVLGMDDEILASLLADAYLNAEKEQA
jgi:hypothetical protein